MRATDNEFSRVEQCFEDLCTCSKAYAVLLEESGRSDRAIKQMGILFISRKKDLEDFETAVAGGKTIRLTAAEVKDTLFCKKRAILGIFKIMMIS